MKLVINGEDRSFDQSLTLASLLDTLGMKADRVAIELNREIAPRDGWSVTHLSEGDRLEIVQFVGGGALSSAIGKFQEKLSRNSPDLPLSIRELY